MCICTYSLGNVHVYILAAGHKKYSYRLRATNKIEKHKNSTEPNKKQKTKKKEYISKANKTHRKLAEIPGALFVSPSNKYTYIVFCSVAQ